MFLSSDIYVEINFFRGYLFTSDSFDRQEINDIPRNSITSGGRDGEQSKTANHQRDDRFHDIL